MPERIPDDWKMVVIQILEEGDPDRIEMTKNAFQGFQALFPGGFACEAYDAFIDALSSSDIEGNRMTGMHPPGATYEFIFDYRRKKVYGKICLVSDHVSIRIISAHRPSKGDSL